jgi:tRNA-Thr(GGU) m(6)t(6)A37 methyltransferase TsaA
MVLVGGVGLGSVLTLAALHFRKKRAAHVYDESTKQHHKEHEEDPHSIPAMSAIGYVHSAFKDRRGVPRQGTLIGLSRAKLKFLPKIHPKLSLEGFQGFSHVWVIVHLHENSHLTKANNNQSIKVRIRAPRLQGGKTGMYSTRTPHRHNSIGLSLAKIERVDLDKGELLVSQLDFVNGTPILDVKPYIPTYDTPSSDIKYPEWIKDDSLLKFNSVVIPDQVKDQLSQLPIHKLEFYGSVAEVEEVINQVLINDLRPPSKVKHQDESEVFEVHLDALLVKFTVNVAEKTSTVVSIEIARH